MKKWVILIVLLLFSPLTEVNGSTISNVNKFYNLVIFIRFADETNYSPPFGFDHYEDLFNGQGPSLKDYYLDVSYDQLTIDTKFADDETAFIFYTDSFERSYFEPYDGINNPNGYTENEEYKREHALLARAVEYAESEGWFRDDLNYDRNQDGLIDSLTFMISGEDTGWDSLLWPHKFSMIYDQADLYGLEVGTYTFNLLGHSQTYTYQANLGILAHETFHLLGAPDLYHYYEHQLIEPVGDWGLMDNTSKIPSHMLGYLKYDYAQWITDIDTISESGQYTLYPLQEGPNMYKIDTPFDNEYVYLEYRDNTGLYESNLPASGLLVYRVNENYEGNADATYLNDVSDDEIFIYRPLVDDTVEPILFIDDVWADGFIDEAALSQYNDYNSANLDDYFMFYSSSGDLLDFYIYNVEEKDGYITFNVSFDSIASLMQPVLNLDVSPSVMAGDIVLLDLEGTLYTVTLPALGQDQRAYYTLDGSMPNEYSTPYHPGDDIRITADKNTLRVAIYEGDVLVTNFEETYLFASNIETDHFSYQNNQHTTWVAQFIEETDLDIHFHEDTYIEEDYDTFRIMDDIYTGSDLGDTRLTLSDSTLVFEFISDDTLSDFYGIAATLDPLNPFSVTLNGPDEVDVALNGEWTDMGVTYPEDTDHTYTLITDSTVDTNSLGRYTITYELYQNDAILIDALTRTVHVVDQTPPSVTLRESVDTLYEGEVWKDPGIIASDTVDDDLIIRKDFDIEPTPGTYTVLYTVRDQSGNTTEITRTVTVLAQEDPLTIECDTTLQTIHTSDTFTRPICTLNGSQMTPNNSINVQVSGLQKIEYEGDYKGFKVTHTLYVYVMAQTQKVDAIIEKRWFDGY